jgi:hypothetical protein
MMNHRPAAKRVHRLILLILSALLYCVSCSAQRGEEQPNRVLFVGNSLLYVGNVPAVFSALASANGHAVRSDMIVKGGATLDQRVADGSVEQALARHAYTTLVLQERGGDLVCSFGPDSCLRSRQAIKALAKLAREHGADIVLLGSYQPLPSASRRLVEAESAAAADAGIPYLDVSENLRQLRSAEPGLAWFYTDGIHPGKDLVLLDAILVYRQLTGSDPEAKDFIVDAPIYTSDSGLAADLRPADAPPPKADTPRGASYAAATIGRLLAVINQHGSSVGTRGEQP